jgi:hypothetical protein
MIDAVALKIFAQLDDPSPGQRANALELLRDHFAKQKPSVKFSHLAADRVGAVTPEHVEELRAILGEFQQMPDKKLNNASSRHLEIRRSYSRLRFCRRAWGCGSPQLTDHGLAKLSSLLLSLLPAFFERAHLSTEEIVDGIQNLCS